MDCPECGESLVGPMMFGEMVCSDAQCGYIEIETEATEGEN